MEFDLHDWQEAALDTWIQKGKKGIVEAVTGAGKTYLALAAINHLYNECRKLRTIIVVPTIALQVQWKERVTKLLPGTKVGLWGDGYYDSSAIKNFFHCLSEPSCLNRSGPLTTAV